MAPERSPSTSPFSRRCVALATCSCVESPLVLPLVDATGAESQPASWVVLQRGQVKHLVVRGILIRALQPWQVMVIFSVLIVESLGYAWMNRGSCRARAAARALLLARTNRSPTH